jgi:hypothetical protein
MIGAALSEYLGLAGEPTKGARMDDPAAVTLVR